MSITKQQRSYAEARHQGASKKDAAIAAGCPERTAAQAGCRLEKNPRVIAHIKRLESVESGSIPVNKSFVSDPKDFLRSHMNDPLADSKERLQAAIALLPYEHVKVGESGKKVQKESDAKEAVQGRFSPSPVPLKRVK